MKKLLALAALASGCAFAQSRAQTTTLTAAGSTPGLWSDSSYHTVQVVTSGSPSACTVRLEGSLDFSNWVDISGSNSCTGTDPGTGNPGVSFSVGGPRHYTYTRVTLITWTGGTNAKITYVGSN
jgi:hypothetical protein